MTRRRKGQMPYDSEHPGRPWMPDTPGHRQRSPRVGPEIKRELDKQIEELRRDIIKNPQPGGENKG